jgi:MraZ protein
MDLAMNTKLQNDEYETEMDNTGRFVMPEPFRKALDEIEGLILMTCYRPGFVVIVPEKIFASSLAKHEKVSVDRWRVSGIAEARREIVRMYFSLSRPAEFDADWGLVIPSPLRETARLKEHLVLTGNIDRVEIWDKESRLAEEIDYDS